MYAAFQHAAADTFDVGQIPRLHSGYGCPHFGGYAGIETVKPTAEWTEASIIDVFP